MNNADTKALWAVRVLDAWKKTRKHGPFSTPCQVIEFEADNATVYVELRCPGMRRMFEDLKDFDAARIAAATALVAEDPSLDPDKPRAQANDRRPDVVPDKFYEGKIEQWVISDRPAPSAPVHHPKCPNAGGRALVACACLGGPDGEGYPLSPRHPWLRRSAIPGIHGMRCDRCYGAEGYSLLNSDDELAAERERQFVAAHALCGPDLQAGGEEKP